MITCYTTPGKAKSARLCELFAADVKAAGGQAQVVYNPPKQLRDGAAVFYGVVYDTQHLWEQAKREGRDWYYIDNSNFDVSRGGLSWLWSCSNGTSVSWRTWTLTGPGR